MNALDAKIQLTITISLYEQVFPFFKKKLSSFAFGRKEYKEASKKWEEWEDGDFGTFLVTWAMIYLPLGYY